jgi:hypothetical protein
VSGTGNDVPKPAWGAGSRRHADPTIGALVATPMVIGAVADRLALLAFADGSQPRYAAALTLAFR